MPLDDLPPESFAEIAIALFEQGHHDADVNEGLEQLGARLVIAGLNAEIAARMLAEAQRHTRLLAAAHHIFKWMCEDEEEIRRVIERRRAIATTKTRRSWLRRASI